MVGKLPDRNQRELFRPLLSDLPYRQHEPVLLTDAIDWQYFEKTFEPLYAKTGQQAVPIQLIVGCLLLKQLKNLGDETTGNGMDRKPIHAVFLRDALF